MVSNEALRQFAEAKFNRRSREMREADGWANTGVGVLAYSEESIFKQRFRGTRVWCCGRVQGEDEGVLKMWGVSVPRTYLRAISAALCLEPGCKNCSRHVGLTKDVIGAGVAPILLNANAEAGTLATREEEWPSSMSVSEGREFGHVQG